MAIVDTIESIKTNLASAYNVAESKGATIPVNRNMENLPPTIASIPTGGGGASEYVRPSDWLPIPAMDGTKDEIYLLNGVGVKDYNIMTFQLSGNGTIDWGDGTSETVSGSNITYTHIYNYEDIPANTWTEHNKTRQVLIHISGNRGEITRFNGAVNYYKNVDGNNVQMSNSASNLVYDITANVESANVILHNSSLTHYKNLEIFDWKGEIINSNMSYMFSGCYSLQSIPQLNTSKVTSMNGMFNDCNSLQSIPQLDTSSVTNMQNMLYNCYSLQSIPQLNTSNVTNMSGMFSGCYSLQSVKLFNFNSNYASAITVSNLTSSNLLSKQALVDLFNSLAVNTNGYSRTIQLGNTLQGYLSNVYVKDSGQLYTIILPTSDTEVDTTKTYYTYNEQTGEYTQVVPDFTSNTFYYELKTATWNRYDICESTEAGAMLALDFARNIKGYTIS